MKIGYLHLGPPQHGIYRYGRLLAQAAQQRSNLSVFEAEVLLTEDQASNRQQLISAAQQLSQADVIHFQFSKFNDRLWGAGWLQLEHLKTFLDHCSCPCVVTLHDVFYVPLGVQGIFKQVLPQVLPVLQANAADQAPRLDSPSASKFRQAARSLKEWGMNTFGAATATLRELAQRVQLILVCSDEEAQRLRDRVSPNKLQVLPHFVESRALTNSPSATRASLGLTGKKVVTLLGFIYPYKGYRLAVEAIPDLPPEVQVIFAGGADADQTFVQTLLELAQAKGVEHRLQITGYLPEAELERYLMATDLAICPFAEFSASGSISTWISIDRPILASDLPQIREYNAIESAAIQIFKPYTATALAQAIQQCLAIDSEHSAAAIARLRQKLSLPHIFDRHLEQYYRIHKSTLIQTK